MAGSDDEQLLDGSRATLVAPLDRQTPASAGEKPSPVMHKAAAPQLDIDHDVHVDVASACSPSPSRRCSSPLPASLKPPMTKTNSDVQAEESATAAVEAPQGAVQEQHMQLKYGYLLKQGAGPWQRKRWNERWFVLHTETGVLKYFRHASLPQTAPFRQDAHGELQLKAPGASLVIQGGDLSSSVPTPFCFRISDGSTQIVVCAATSLDFREWIGAISAIISPRPHESTAQCEPSDRAVDTKIATTSTDPLDQKLSRESEQTSGNTSVSTTDVTAAAIEEGDEAAVDDTPDNMLAPKDLTYSSWSPSSLWQAALLLMVLNPLMLFVCYGSASLVYSTMAVANAALVWVLWLRPSVSTTRASCREDQDEASRSSSSSRCSLSSTSRGSLRASTSSQASPSTRTTISIASGIQPKAGASIEKCAPEPAPMSYGCWTSISGTRFNVRQGPNYRRTKLKAPSNESLLEIIAFDAYQSPAKIDNIASRMDLRHLQTSPDVPLDLVVINCQVPSYQPSNPIWGEKQGDGVGLNFVLYLTIPPELRADMESPTPSSGAVRLLRDFLAEPSAVRDRFKAIGIVVNAREQLQLGRTERHLLETYNGQPILTRPQHRFYRGPGYFEIDIDVHQFNYMARRTLAGVAEHFCTMVVDFGFVIEAQDDSELPECMLGAVRFCKIDVRNAPELV